MHKIVVIKKRNRKDEEKKGATVVDKNLQLIQAFGDNRQ